MVRARAGAEHVNHPATTGSSVARAGLAFRAHSGWAVLVAVAGSVAAPVVIHRQRIELVDPEFSGSRQPYHLAKPMKLEHAAALLDRCAATAHSMARKALQDLMGELARQHYDVAGSCILLGSGRTTTDLAAILASHPMIHTAEGEFFRQALRSACESCGLPVASVPERELLSQSAAALGLSPEQIERQASAMGKSIGPPWTRDEKLCAIAACLVLQLHRPLPEQE